MKTSAWFNWDWGNWCIGLVFDDMGYGVHYVRCLFLPFLFTIRYERKGICKLSYAQKNWIDAWDKED